LYDSPSVVPRPTVHEGPPRGRAAQIVLALPAHDPQVGNEPLTISDSEIVQELFATYAPKIGSLPEVKEVIQASPRRGKRSSRELVFMTIRFVKGIKTEEAEKIIRKIITATRSRINRLTPAVRQKRREHHRAKREARRLRRQSIKLQHVMLGQTAP
jgi:hypothetical protein